MFAVIRNNWRRDSLLRNLLSRSTQELWQFSMTVTFRGYRGRISEFYKWPLKSIFY